MFVRVSKECCSPPVPWQPPCYPTIQSGVDAVAPGGTVSVVADTYVENLVITKPLTLISEAPPPPGTDPCAPVVVPDPGGGGGTIGGGGGIDIGGEGPCGPVVYEGGVMCVIDGGGAGPCVTISGAGPVTVMGFKITNGGGAGGGGVLVKGGAIATIRNNLITDCHVAQAGGGILVQGGGTSAEIRCNTISANLAGTDGGGIAVDAAAACVVSDSMVLANTAAGSGGGFHVMAAGTLVVLENNDFLDNTAVMSGGAISTDGVGGDVTVSEDVVIANQAFIGGGGIRLEHEGSAVVRYTVVSGCSAEDGGGIYVDSDELVISIHDNDTILDNTAGDEGGGIWLRVGEGHAGIVTNTIAANDARAGGGIHIQGNGGAASIIVKDNKIENNHASQHGGGIQVWQGTPAIVIGADGDPNVIQNNDAVLTGGGITIGYYSQGVKVLFNQIRENHVLGPAPGLGTLAALATGGGLHIRLHSGGAQRIVCRSNSFEENVSDTLDGGGAAVVIFSEASFDGDVFLANEADDDGGGLHVTAFSDVILDEVQVLGNNAHTGLGGGIRETCVSMVWSKGNCLFSGNLAAQLGGGLAMRESVLILDQAHVEGNTADEAGGVYGLATFSSTLCPSPEAALTLRESHLFSNLAVVNGGALIAQSIVNASGVRLDLTLTRCLVAYNGGPSSMRIINGRPGSVNVRFCEISGSNPDLVQVVDSTAGSIERFHTNLFSGGTATQLRLSGLARADLRANRFEGGGGTPTGILLEGNATLANCRRNSIVNHVPPPGGFGINNSAGTLAIATHNWWGHPLGATPLGSQVLLGDGVSANVDSSQPLPSPAPEAP